MTTGSQHSTATSSRRAASRPEPFSVDHFRRYARLLVLDNGEQWDPEDFQLEIVADLFSDEFVAVWTIIPEANGKSTLMGGVGLYWADFKPAAEVLLAAAAREQAEIMYGQAAGFVRRTPGMNARFRCYDGYRRIKNLRPGMGGRLQVRAADDATGDGVLYDLALVDELHRQRNLKLYRTWFGKAQKRNGRLGVISTAGEPDSEFENAREEIMRSADEVVIDGAHRRAVNGRTVLHDWSVPSSANVEDMEAVKAANPFSGITVQSLAEKRASPTMTIGHWRRFVCNQATRAVNSAISIEEWSARRTEDGIPEGVPVWVGADFGWKWDTTALVPLWMPEHDRRVFDRVEIIVPPRNGFSTPPEDVQAAFLRIHERNPIATVVMDENAGGAQIAGWLEDVIGAEVVAHAQSHSPMAQAYERWMEGLREGWIWHTGDREFTSHVLNAVAKLLPGGQARFDRPVQSRGGDQQDRRVIDALIAASMVHSVAVDERDVSIPLVVWA
jgi:phage terminase large subunit-like protein